MHAAGGWGVTVCEIDQDAGQTLFTDELTLRLFWYIRWARTSDSSEAGQRAVGLRLITIKNGS